MFGLPPGDKTADGLTDEQPLRLDGIDRDEFCSLLKYLYPRYVIDLYGPVDADACLARAEVSKDRFV